MKDKDERKKEARRAILLTSAKKEANKSKRKDGNMFIPDDTALKRYNIAIDKSKLSKEDKDLSKRVARKDVQDKEKNYYGKSLSDTLLRDSIIKNVEAGKKKEKKGK